MSTFWWTGLKNYSINRVGWLRWYWEVDRGDGGWPIAEGFTRTRRGAKRRVRKVEM